MPPKIAIASCGLGHVYRGIEAWAETTAMALHGRGHAVRLFQGGGTPDTDWKEVVPCLKRFDATTTRIVKLLRGLGGWRYGLGSGYQAEETTFALNLWLRVANDYDILHVQDPTVAIILDRLNRAGLSRPRVIIGHGTEENVKTLQRYSYLQHLAPWYMEDYAPDKPARQMNFAVPNFIDCDRFVPGNKCAARKQWGLPQGSLIFLCVAAIKKVHKRIDYLIEEFAAFAERANVDVQLVIAGGREEDTDSLRQMGSRLLKGRVLFFENVQRSRIPSLYQASDVFVLTSLKEMFPVALLEAMSSGLAVLCNKTPVLEWIVRSGGAAIDLSRAGALADAFIQTSSSGEIPARAVRARCRVEELFSETTVITQIEQMYETVLSRKRIM